MIFYRKLVEKTTSVCRFYGQEPLPMGIETNVPVIVVIILDPDCIGLRLLLPECGSRINTTFTAEVLLDRLGQKQNTQLFFFSSMLYFKK